MPTPHHRLTVGRAMQNLGNYPGFVVNVAGNPYRVTLAVDTNASPPGRPYMYPYNHQLHSEVHLY